MNLGCTRIETQDKCERTFEFSITSDLSESATDLVPVVTKQEGSIC